VYVCVCVARSMCTCISHTILHHTIPYTHTTSQVYQPSWDIFTVTPDNITYMSPMVSMQAEGWDLSSSRKAKEFLRYRTYACVCVRLMW
jgi:hypothetical protein